MALLPIGYPPLHTGVLLPKLFDKSFLPVYPEDVSGEKYLSLFYLADSALGLLKLPFILWEAEKLQKILESSSPPGRVDLSIRSLSLISNSLEFLTWSGERQFLEISPKSLFIMKRVYYLGKIILYSCAAIDSGKKIWQAKKSSNAKENLRGKVQFCSHLTYLACVTIGFSILALGVNFSKRTVQVLHGASLLLDLILIGLEWDKIPFFQGKSFGVFLWKQN